MTDFKKAYYTFAVIDLLYNVLTMCMHRTLRLLEQADTALLYHRTLESN